MLEAKLTKYAVWNVTWRSYNVALLFINYIIPLVILALTYSVVGRRLWGGQAIGEHLPGQAEMVRSKRRVRHCIVVCV